MEIAVMIVLAAVVAVVPVMVIVAALRPDKSGRHKGLYIPAKDRPGYPNATNHSAVDEGGPRSRRFPELER